MATLNQISDSVLDLGQFIGLLQNNDTVNIAWFDTPINSLETIDNRLALLISTFYDVLDSPIKARVLVALIGYRLKILSMTAINCRITLCYQSKEPLPVLLGWVLFCRIQRML